MEKITNRLVVPLLVALLLGTPFNLLILFILLRRYFIEGISSSGIKR